MYLIRPKFILVALLSIESVFAAGYGYPTITKTVSKCTATKAKTSTLTKTASKTTTKTITRTTDKGSRTVTITKTQPGKTNTVTITKPPSTVTKVVTIPQSTRTVTTTQPAGPPSTLSVTQTRTIISTAAVVTLSTTVVQSTTVTSTAAAITVSTTVVSTLVEGTTVTSTLTSTAAAVTVSTTIISTQVEPAVTVSTTVTSTQTGSTTITSTSTRTITTTSVTATPSCLPLYSDYIPNGGFEYEISTWNPENVPAGAQITQRCGDPAWVNTGNCGLAAIFTSSSNQAMSIRRRINFCRSTDYVYSFAYKITGSCTVEFFSDDKSGGVIGNTGSPAQWRSASYAISFSESNLNSFDVSFVFRSGGDGNCGISLDIFSAISRSTTVPQRRDEGSNQSPALVPISVSEIHR